MFLLGVNDVVAAAGGVGGAFAVNGDQLYVFGMREERIDGCLEGGGDGCKRQ